MNLFDVIRRPILTEKNTFLMTEGKYTFEVAHEANKKLVKDAVEQIFGVNVTAVNIINVPRKRVGTRRTSRRAGFKPAQKKAIVTLLQGQRIEAFEEV
jgi:large subunit ribosomal protein L23